MSTPEKIVLVVCPSKQFKLEMLDRFGGNVSKYWLNNKFIANGKTYINITSPMMMRGMRGVEVEFWGEFYRMEEIDEMEKEAYFARLK